VSLPSASLSPALTNPAGIVLNGLYLPRNGQPASNPGTYAQSGLRQDYFRVADHTSTIRSNHLKIALAPFTLSNFFQYRKNVFPEPGRIFAHREMPHLLHDFYLRARNRGGSSFRVFLCT
jgi:hypothetical protein